GIRDRNVTGVQTCALPIFHSRRLRLRLAAEMSRGSKLRWLWRAPARALGRARDLYVRGLTGCARHVPSDAAFGYPVFVPAPMSRSEERRVGKECRSRAQRA